MVYSSRFAVYGLQFVVCLRNFVFLFTISCCLSSAVYSQTPEQLYSQASAQYKGGQFEQASITYEKILVQGYRTAEIYYNLGNCYYKLKNTGKAILNYERAQKLAPDDEDITHNLKLTQLKTVDKLVPVPQLAITSAFKNFSSGRSSSGWSLYAVIAVWVALLIFTVYFFVARKAFVAISGLFFVVLSVVFVSLAVKQNSAEENSGQGVLLVQQVVVKSAPDESGNNLFTIHEGVKFQILDVVGNWNKIRLIDGKVGWVEKNLFEKI